MVEGMEMRIVLSGRRVRVARAWRLFLRNLKKE
jgi:hypothetical protein